MLCCRCAIHDGGTPGVDSLECDCCFAVGVLYMMGERLALNSIQQKDSNTLNELLSFLCQIEPEL